MLKQLSDVVARHARRADVEEDAPPAVLDTRVPPIIRIINGSLDEDPSSPNAIVLNGRVDPSTLRFLKVDGSYQRPLSMRAEIFDALKSGVVVPNIDIGVRGQNFTTDGSDILIHSPAFIIDGWQRVGTALRLLEMIPGHPLRIFATVHFGTDELWERHRFTELNKNVKKVSPNLHLRNMRDGNEAILTLYGLCHNQRDFALHGRVCWSQNMRRGEIMTAMQVGIAAMRLHAHHAGVPGNGAVPVAASLLVAAKKIGLPTFRANVAIFFGVIEECFGLRAIEITRQAPQIRGSFQIALGRMFSSHIDFWDQGERTFFVSADMRRKLAKFPLNDPHVRSLAGSGGAAKTILYDLLLSHMNSGRRTGHLRSRYAKG